MPPTTRGRTRSPSPDNSPNKKARTEEHKHKDEDSQEQSTSANHATSSENQNDDWKFRPPYKIHDKGEGFEAKYEASCHCGKVQFQVSRDAPLDAKYCHCTTCQQLHGAPFQWAAIFHKTDINFSHGHHDLVWYDPGSKSTKHQLPCKISCSTCRTPLMDEGRNMILMYPTLIHWKEGRQGEVQRKKFEVSCHMFYTRRVVDVKDGKPKWAELNDKSELMDEE